MTPEENRQFDAMELRIKFLEERGRLLDESDTQDLKNEKMEQAHTFALMSIVQELAIRAGLSPKEYSEHFERRYQYYYDFVLTQAENISPSIAAELDIRPEGESAPVEEYPPLFPEGE